jgi:hypothetical protein
MGQAITVGATVAGNAAIFDANRSISGQDGGAYTSAAEATEDEGFPARLAAEIFAGDSRVTSVYAGSNGIVVVRQGGWDDPSLQSTVSVIEDFFVFYKD